MKSTPLALAASLAALSLGLGACSPAKEDQPPKPKVTASTDSAEPTPPAAASNPASLAASAKGVELPKVGPAPAWRLTDVNGATVTSDQFKGKVVVVDFWATWCPPCVKEIPEYVELAKKYGPDGLAIVGVSLDEGGPEVVKKFASAKGVNYPLVMGTQEVVAAFGGVAAIPTAFLIDRDGQIRDRKEGLVEPASYERKIVSLLH